MPQTSDEIGIYFIHCSEFNAYLKQIKVMLSTEKKNFSLEVAKMIYIFPL